MRSGARLLALWLLIVCVLGVARDARAQGIAGVQPARLQAEVFGGYSYLGSNLVNSGSRLNLNGASGAVILNVRDWLGFLGDVGVYHQGDVANTGLSLTISSYQFGARVRLRNQSRLNLFAQAMAGVGHAGGSLYTRPIPPSVTPLGTNNGLLFTIGGGADWKLTPRLSVRLIQAEYLYSQFLNGADDRQNNLRLSAGVVFHF